MPSTRESIARVLEEKLADGIAFLPPSATPRRLFGPSSFPGKISAIVGMRRSGKTTFLHQMRREALEQGIPLERLPFINFEDERLGGIEGEDLAFLVEEYFRRFPAYRKAATVIWHFDEIQTVPGWEPFLRRLLDTEKVEVRITGSSAALLSREIATALRGRAWEIPLYPFSFAEYLSHSGHPVPPRPDFLSSVERSSLEADFRQWLVSGGFPEVQGILESLRRTVLSDYVDVAMLRDVIERHNLSNVVSLRWMVRQLLCNAGSAFSVEKFHAALKSQGLAVAKDTVHQILSYLEDCFLVCTVWMDSDSERRRMVNPRKAYPVDSALMALYDRSGKANTGHALETMVLVELLRRRAEVGYVKTGSGREVDFLARMPSGEIELIQVCADVSNAETAEREFRALIEAAPFYPGAVCRLLTLNRPGSLPEVPQAVLVQPTYEWMLGGERTG
ncbi:MAG: ATP-binding protein [Rectinemataceae bacterium]|nr:ATP-binding protein [Rectinemataceae bacterium]